MQSLWQDVRFREFSVVSARSASAGENGDQNRVTLRIWTQAVSPTALLNNWSLGLWLVENEEGSVDGLDQPSGARSALHDGSVYIYIWSLFCLFLKPTLPCFLLLSQPDICVLLWDPPSALLLPPQCPMVLRVITLANFWMIWWRTTPTLWDLWRTQTKPSMSLCRSPCRRSKIWWVERKLKYASLPNIL